MRRVKVRVLVLQQKTDKKKFPRNQSFSVRNSVDKTSSKKFVGISSSHYKVWPEIQGFVLKVG